MAGPITLYDSNNVEIAVDDGVALPSGQKFLPLSGVDGSGNVRKLLVGADGAVMSTPSGTGTQAVSGTITANVGTTGGLALDATLTGGTQKAIARGGAKGATTAADLTSTAEGADHQGLDVQLYHGGVAKDPTAIRLLTSADAVTANQGPAAALSGKWPVGVTDGTNLVAVKAASTAAAAADPSLVVGLSPNSPLPAGTNTLGKVDQGAPAVGANAWPVAVVDTTNVIVKPGDAANNAVRVNIVAGAGSSGTALADNSTFTEGTTSLTPVGGEFQDAGTDLTAGKAGIARMTAKRALHVNLRNASATEIGTAAAPIRTDPTGTTTQPISGTVTANQGTAAAAASAWPTKVTDGTNVAAVKAASTAAAAADPALVVSLSPNSPTPGVADTVGTTAALGALNATAAVALAGLGSASFHLAAGTLAATLVAETSLDGGTTWIASTFYDPATKLYAFSIVLTNPNGTVDRSIVVDGGTTNVRVRVSAFTSGTANATLRAVAADQVTTILQGVGGVVDPNNSSTTNLAAGATFTGAATSLLPYAHLQVVLFFNNSTDAVPTCDMFIDFSQDGTNWDETRNYPSLSSNFANVVSIEPRAPFFRVRVKNNAIVTTANPFRLSAILKPVAQQDLTDVPTVSIGNSVTVTQSNLTGTRATPWFCGESSFKDTGNSTTTSLGIGATFTGTFKQIFGPGLTGFYAGVVVSIQASNNSAVDGVDIQWSMDGVTVHGHDYGTFNILDTQPFVFLSHAKMPYYRLVYTNGGATSVPNIQSMVVGMLPEGIRNDGIYPTHTRWTNSYAARLQVIPSTLTAGTTYFSIRNVTTNTRLWLRLITYALAFTGTAAASASIFEIARFSAATPTGGTVLTPEPTDLSRAASSADVRFAPGGLTTTGVTFKTPFHLAAIANQLAAATHFGQLEWPIDPRMLQQTFMLQNGEGIAIRANNALVAGVSLLGSIHWSEKPGV